MITLPGAFEIHDGELSRVGPEPASLFAATEAEEQPLLPRAGSVGTPLQAGTVKPRTGRLPPSEGPLTPFNRRVDSHATGSQAGTPIGGPMRGSEPPPSHGVWSSAALELPPASSISVPLVLREPSVATLEVRPNEAGMWLSLLPLEGNALLSARDVPLGGLAHVEVRCHATAMWGRHV